MRLWFTLYLFVFIPSAAMALPGPGLNEVERKGSPERIRVIIRDRVQIKAEVIRLGDLAEVSALTEKERKQYENLVITSFADDRERMQIPGSYIRSRIEELSKIPNSVKIVVPDQVEVERSKDSSEEKLKSKISQLIKELSPHPEEVRIEISGLSETVKEIPLSLIEKGSLEAVHKKTYWRGRTFFSLSDASGEKVTFSAKISWFAKRWKAKQNIARGMKLHVGLFERVETEIRRNRDNSVKSATIEELAVRLRNSTSRTALSKGSVLRLGTVSTEADVKAGMTINAVAGGADSLRLSIPARLLQSARIGDTARAKILKTGRVVRGVLSERKELIVQN